MSKTVLLIQKSKLQESIWYSTLTAQKLTVIRDIPHIDLQKFLQASDQGLAVMPNLLIIEMSTQLPNPYAFCRWCQEHYPNLKIILTNDKRSEISAVERRWAINQGAVDLLPGFQQTDLLASVFISVNRVLEILGEKTIEQQQLVPILHSVAASHSPPPVALVSTKDKSSLNPPLSPEEKNSPPPVSLGSNPTTPAPPPRQQPRSAKNKPVRKFRGLSY